MRSKTLNEPANVTVHEIRVNSNAPGADGKQNSRFVLYRERFYMYNIWDSFTGETGLRFCL